MKNKLLKYLIRPIIFVSSFAFCLCQQLFAQQQIKNVEKTEISGGAEFNIMLQEAIRNGNVDMFRYRGQQTPPSLYSPSVITTYDGITFDEDAANGEYYNIPPDPIGAAGPSHLVSVVNTSIEWFTKAGVQEVSKRLGKNTTTIVGSFFESLAPVDGTFDPKVIYDQYASRFVVVTLERVGTVDDDAGNISRILLAVSDDSNPNGTWYFHEIDSKLTITSIDGTHDSWADYPGLAVDEEAVYVTANMFRFSGGFSLDSRVWIIDKGLSGGFYDGGSATDAVYAHGTLAGLGTVPTTQPAHMFGTPSSSTLGTFLVSFGWYIGATDRLSVILVDDPLGSITFTNTFVSLGDIHSTSSFPDAPQLGTATLVETNDSRALNAVWRNDSLWVVNCVNPPSGTDAGQITAHWYKIETDGAISLSDQGNIGGETIATGCYTFFPSIAVNSSNDVCIGFSASASTIYPGCYYTGRLSSDPAGFTITPDEVRAGLDYYIRLFGGSRNRWGDYSGTSVDPSDDQTFYVFNEYALARGTVIDPPYPGQDGRWGTVFGVVPVTALPVELSSFTAKVLTNGGVQLYWITETEVNNYGFEVERKVSSKQLAEDNWEKIGFVEGHGNSNSPKEYNYLDKGISYGNYAYRLKQIDNDGTFEYSEIIEVNAGDIPDGFVLEQNYPNPFNPATKIKFAVNAAIPTSLKVYDILGNEIAQLFNETTIAGKIYEIEFDASYLSSGVYYYRLSTPRKSLARKMLLLR